MATYPLPSHEAKELDGVIANIIAESLKTGHPVDTLGMVAKSHSSTRDSSSIKFHSDCTIYIQAESAWEYEYDPDTLAVVRELAKSLLVFLGRAEAGVVSDRNIYVVETKFGDISASHEIYDVSMTLIPGSQKSFAEGIGDDVALYLAQLGSLPISEVTLTRYELSTTETNLPPAETKVEAPANNGNTWFQVWTPELTVPERAESLLVGGYHEEEAEEPAEPVAHEEAEPSGFTALNDSTGDTDGMWFTVWTSDGNEVTERIGFTAHTEGIGGSECNEDTEFSDPTEGIEFSGSIKLVDSNVYDVARILLDSLEKQTPLSIVSEDEAEIDLFELAMLAVLRHKSESTSGETVRVSFPIDFSSMGIELVQDSELTNVHLLFHYAEVEPAGYQIGTLQDFDSAQLFPSRKISIDNEESYPNSVVLYFEGDDVWVTQPGSDPYLYELSIEELKDYLRLNK